jgi:small GTP-binding protein
LKEGFKKSYIPTLGVDFAQKKIDFEGVKTNLVIWDIAGQAAYAGLRKRYYEGASGLILVYSVVNRTSFDNASKWLVEAHGFMQKLPPLIIAANKIDLSPTHPKEETVSPEEGKEFAKTFSEKLNTQAYFIETSALKGINIDDAFYKLVEMMVESLESKKGGPKQKAPVQPSESATTEVETAASAIDKQEETPSIATTASTSEPKEETPISESLSKPAAPSKATTIETEMVTAQTETEIDHITALEQDSAYLQDDSIGKEMSKLVDLRAKLKAAEEELASEISELETTLLNLKNVVHVKKIMYEHLKKELETTRKEWAEAYNDYINTDQRKKDEIAKRSRKIIELRKRIEEIGKTVRSRVSDLEMKKFGD